jgi:hypothetical protein
LPDVLITVESQHGARAQIGNPLPYRVRFALVTDRDYANVRGSHWAKRNLVMLIVHRSCLSNPEEENILIR